MKQKMTEEQARQFDRDRKWLLALSDMIELVAKEIDKYAHASDSPTATRLLTRQAQAMVRELRELATDGA